MNVISHSMHLSITSSWFGMVYDTVNSYIYLILLATRLIFGVKRTDTIAKHNDST
jgi:hypothetical protein